LNLQSSAAAHPACALVLQWFAQQAKKEGDELIGP
jgi:LysR family glycine cleavage system transcriptional activator